MREIKAKLKKNKIKIKKEQISKKILLIYKNK